MRRENSQFLEDSWRPLKEPFLFCCFHFPIGWRSNICRISFLSTESIQSTALTLESIDYVHSSDSLALGMLSVGDSITDHVLQEDFQDTAGLLVDQARDTLHATSASQTTDSRLCDTLDVIAKHLAMTLGATLSEPFASFATSRHISCSS